MDGGAGRSTGALTCFVTGVACLCESKSTYMICICFCCCPPYFHVIFLYFKYEV